MIEFNDAQIAYMKSDVDDHVFLEACPGSGKTEVVAAKFCTEMRRWRKFPSSIAVLSFSNSATYELKERVESHLADKKNIFPHFLGTFDSFIYKNIVNPLANCLVDYDGENGDYTIKIVDKTVGLGFRTKYGIAKLGKIHAHHFSRNQKTGRFNFDTNIAANNRKLNATEIEDWQAKDLDDTKTRMLNNGYATYRDIENMALQALTSSECVDYTNILAKKFPLLMIDECQDLSYEQLEILQLLVQRGVKLHFIGDLHQSIYGFRDVDPISIENFTFKNRFKKLELTRNYRSCQNIIDICGQLTDRKKIIGQLTSLEPACYVVQYKESPIEIVSDLKGLCKNFKNIVIVSRGHSNIQKFHTSQSKIKTIHKLAIAIELFDENNMESLSESLAYYSEFLKDHLKESVKPNSLGCPLRISSNLEWRRFLFQSLRYLHSTLNSYFDKNWSAWMRMLKISINGLGDQPFILEEYVDIITTLKNIAFRAPSGEASQAVKCLFDGINRNSLTLNKKTIHSAKGETHDVTILISNIDGRGSKGSYWGDWLKDSKSEAARFAYVASSRPKHLLIWAVKTLKPKEAESLGSLGFHIL